ncbi:MAG: RNA-binding transcriptional accessory protein [Clostridia bacterium]|nr:RNA-binding transcriptional accessory protein [Clostridia bacterium]
MDIPKIITEELGITINQTQAVIKLYDEGCTIPFIARYRKEEHGSLDDEQLRKLEERLLYLRNLQDRKDTVIASIEEQGKMTDELRAAIDKAMTLVEVEDLYRPYKQKKKTRAIIAKEKGLGPLADAIYAQELKEPVEKIAEGYIDEEKGVANVEEAIQGAKDIIAEMISDEPEYRKWIRTYLIKNAFIKTIIKEKDEEEIDKSTYAMYADFSEPVKSIPGHRVLAINRGENEKALQVKVSLENDEAVFNMFYDAILKQGCIYTEELIKDIIKDAYDRLIFPSVEREVRNELTEKAEADAIVVFSKNLKQILMQAPISGQVVLGFDPGYRVGSKLAVVDETGKVLDTAVVFCTMPHDNIEKANKLVLDLINKHHVTLVSIGNGTASRESEKFIANLIQENNLDTKYVITNEAGASIYSSSKLATEEFPDYDVLQRGAISIARRLQDPLAELVKIEPKSIGVGQYQHDMNQKNLKTNLDNVVEDVVNNVGVDLNTASVSLLKYVAGVNEKIAKAIVDYRENEKQFTSRTDILKVKGLGAKAFEQCAGFLRIPNAENVLDQTAVHPESYDAANSLVKELGVSFEDIKNKKIKLEVDDKKLQEISEKIKVGLPTLQDIVAELNKPGRDPRSEMPKPIFKSDVMDIKDLKPGMVLDGVVRNLVDFGVFVDIGVHQDGMVHISEITDKYIKHPLDALNIGDNVKVKVISVDEKRNRIALTMRLNKEAEAPVKAAKPAVKAPVKK